MTNPRMAYRENDARGASGVRLVVLLYEQIIQDLGRAVQALEQNDIELRTKYINHAVLVIGYLQSPLDFERGGKVAKDLDHFYNVLRQNMVRAQCLASNAALQHLITDVLAVRDAWIEVERAGHSLGARGAKVSASTTGAGNTEDPNAAAPSHGRMDWRG